MPQHPNVSWIQVDLANWPALKQVMGHIKQLGGANFIVHLAAYYDFSLEDSPEYLRTNIKGTRHMLELAKWLCVERFVFSSSVAACAFPDAGVAISEKTPADADFAYARSKRAGEEMVCEYSRWFPCSIVRLAAVFSDWCEYAFLYVFLSTWLSSKWDSRVLAGHGLAAVPYIHIRDVDRFLLTILERSPTLPTLGTYVASPDGATSQRELFDLASRFYFGRTANPLLLPKLVCWLGVAGRDLLGRLVGRRPFERLWMLDYLDQQLVVDASWTRRALGWEATPRLHIQRRLLYLIEKMKSQPREWSVRNEAVMKRSELRPALIIHDAMVEAREAIVDAITAHIRSPVRSEQFPGYATTGWSELKWDVGVVYELLVAAARTGDRTLLLDSVRDLTLHRLASGVSVRELGDMLAAVGEISLRELQFKAALSDLAAELCDFIALSMAMVLDSLEDTWEFEHPEESAAATTETDLEALVDRLNAFYRPVEMKGDDMREALE